MPRRARKITERLKRWCRYGYLRLLRIDDSPERIARSAAMGAFIGIMPTLGVGIILCIIGAFVFRLSKVAAVIGSFVMNPITTPIVWSLSMTLGGMIFWQDTAALVAHGGSQNPFSEQIGSAALMFVTGNTILAVVIATAVYLTVKYGIIKHRVRKAAKRQKKLERAKTGGVGARTS
ncbi:MAG: DUF2062 domain-containing protein [Thermodesulfobacteriota bacterium]